MKKFSIILNIILLIVTLFFIVFAKIQTKLAKELQATADRLALETVSLVEKSEQAVQEAQAITKLAMREAERTRTDLIKCQEGK